MDIEAAQSHFAPVPEFGLRGQWMEFAPLTMPPFGLEVALRRWGYTTVGRYAITTQIVIGPCHVFYPVTMSDDPLGFGNIIVMGRDWQWRYPAHDHADPVLR